jgi:CheY-like chemotaxis protein
LKTPIFNNDSILLIDDDDSLFLSQALETLSSNFSLTCIYDVDHLFEVIEKHNPSIIFIDYQMPKRSGLDCLRKIKNNSDYKGIPVVMWSTSLMPNNLMAAYREGAQAFV